MAKLREQFGRRLEELLKKHKMKQCELAEKLDIDPQSISRMIAGKHFPKEENIEKMIKAFNIQPEELFKFSNNADDKELIEDINRLISNAPSSNTICPLTRISPFATSTMSPRYMSFNRVSAIPVYWLPVSNSCTLTGNGCAFIRRCHQAWVSLFPKRWSS